MWKFALIIISIGFVSTQRTLQVVDYCDSKICDNSGNRHITCDLPKIQANPTCARVLELNDENKQAFVDAHNKFRNKIANGEQPGFKSATRMTTVEWDDTLADYALLNVMRCDFAHDCHATDQMKFSGQNIAGLNTEDLNEVAATATNNWYKEVADSTQDNIDNCCSLNVAHFTQVIRANSNKIGCAVGVIPFKGNDMTYIVCNYSFGNLAGKSYISGPPASDCKTGNNPQYPALCSSAEQIDANSPN